MFFLSGLFVWSSLVRKQSGRFLADRLIRLGPPMLAAIYLLMPVALYPVYLLHANEPSVAEYWRQFRALPFWPCGPQWFLWQLLLLNAAVAAWYKIDPQWGNRLATIARASRINPRRFIACLLIASAIAYVPLAIAYTPWAWLEIHSLAFQYSRPLHYTVYFVAGAVVGAYGLERGLLAPDSVLKRRWPIALGAAIIGLALWMAPTAAIADGRDEGPLWLQVAAAFGFVISCASGCLVVLAVCLRFGARRHRILDSLSANAYGMYLVHYPFVVWMQFALLHASLPAVVKAAIVAAVAISASWGLTASLRSIPLGIRLVAARRRAIARSP
jgi:peptidoglycan/LPS O-acetylase OafA/YrhL